MLITNEYDRPVRPSSTSNKHDRAAAAADRPATWSCFLVWLRKQIASAEVFSMGQVCWKTLGVVSMIQWKPLMCWNVLALRVVQCTKKKHLTPFSSYGNMHLFSDSSFKPLASGYLGKYMLTLNTIGLVVCEDIIVCTPSLCIWQLLQCDLHGLALVQWVNYATVA